MNNYYVYILSSDSGTLYIGVTSDLEKRIDQHKNKLIEGFTQKYDCNKLVYFEETNNVHTALEREKQLKGWTRIKKQNLIKTLNPGWKDLGNNGD